jgi:DNA polymerase-3 subunit delta'
VPLHPLYGHDALRQRLATAVAARRLPPALLLVGAAGVGKQRLGLWLAQGLVCEQGPGAPCETCHACRLALQLSHPDVHWFFPIQRPRADDAKQVEEAEEALGAALAARRESPLYGPADGMHALYLPLVRALHRRAQLRPAMARCKVFVVGEADRLVPQASSPEAANAMLKVLEEPPPDTFFILTTTQPAALLPTIRSRVVVLRVGRLAPEVIARFLQEVPQPPVPTAEARRRAERADGAIGAALAASRAGGAAGGAAAEGARALLAAAERGGVARWRYALGVRSFGGRGEFTDLLDAAAELLRDAVAVQLRSGAGAAADSSTRLLAQVRAIDQTRRLAQGNVNPQLLAADLLRRLAEAS